MYNACRPFSSRNNVGFSAEKAKKAKSGTLLYNIQSIPENKSTSIRIICIFRELLVVLFDNQVYVIKGMTYPDTRSFGISPANASAMSFDPILAMH